MEFRKAIVPFGDFSGETAIDSVGVPFIDELESDVSVPSTHLGVGFAVSIFDLRGRRGTVRVEVAAVDKSRFGSTLDEVRRKAAGAALEAQIFAADVPLERLLSYMKYFQFTAMLRGFEGIAVESEPRSHSW